MSIETNSAPPEKTEFIGLTSVRSTVDIPTYFVILSAFALIITAIVLGGSLCAFIDKPPIYIVIGSTFGITITCYSFRDVGNAFTMVISTVFNNTHNLASTALHVLNSTKLTHIKSLLEMEPHVCRLLNKEMLHKSLKIMLNKSSHDEIQRIMQGKIQATARRHFRTIDVLGKAAEISPTIGMIGTLCGLSQMLGNLSDPSMICLSMTVTLLTTFYGVVMANTIFSLIATKLECNSSENALINKIHVVTTTSKGRRENPRHLEVLPDTTLPPDQQIKCFG
jgi:chemotaxis protein MotA